MLTTANENNKCEVCGMNNCQMDHTANDTNSSNSHMNHTANDTNSSNSSHMENMNS